MQSRSGLHDPQGNRVCNRPRFTVEELDAVPTMIAALPFGGTRWRIATDLDPMPEAIQITPPQCFDPYWTIWKALDGKVVIEADREHPGDGNYRRESMAFDTMEAALGWSGRSWSRASATRYGITTELVPNIWDT
jgi:hypothetical protein